MSPDFAKSEPKMSPGPGPSIKTTPAHSPRGQFYYRSTGALDLGWGRLDLGQDRPALGWVWARCALGTGDFGLQKRVYTGSHMGFGDLRGSKI